MSEEITRQIRVYGIVQGVGFRPTVSRHAADIGESTEMSVTKVLTWKSMHRDQKKKSEGFIAEISE